MSTLADSASVETWSGKDRSDENFPVGSLLIAPHLRKHVHAFYAFARNGDDIADSPALEAEDKIGRLDRMEAVLTGARDTGSPSATLLRASLAECGVTDRHARDLLVAFRRDATKSRYANWDELIEYCRYSAMPVGRHVLDLHGEASTTHAPSDALCAALQILNHIQDCGKDLQTLDRCYVPDEMMAAEGVSVADLTRPELLPGMRRVLEKMLHRTDALNCTGADLPRFVRDRRLRLETGVIVNLSHRLARRLHHGDPLVRRVSLTKTDALVSILSALRYVP